MKNNKTKKVKCAGGIVINDCNQVVIVNQNHDSWSLPKGHIDPGENALDAAKREIYEETGIIDLKFVKELGSYNRYRIGLDGNDDLSELKTISIYLFTSRQQILKPIDPNNPFAKWVHYVDVKNYLTHKEDIKFFINTIDLWLKK